MSYCCDPAETSRACTTRDFCSQNALTISMQMASCPFVTKTCQGTTPNILLKPNKTESIIHAQKDNKNFNSTAICHYKITADLSTLTKTEVARGPSIFVSVKSYSNVYVHLNNGTTLNNAGDAIQVNPFNTGMDFTYRATNNAIYLVLVATNDNPAVNISLKLQYISDIQYKNAVQAQNAANNQTKQNTTQNNTIVIVKNVNVTVNKTKSIFDNPKWKPSLTSYVMLAVIVFGVLLFGIIECFTWSKNSKEKDFDIVEGFKFSERKNVEEDNDSNRKLNSEMGLINENNSYNHSQQDLLDSKSFSKQIGDPFKTHMSQQSIGGNNDLKFTSRNQLKTQRIGFINDFIQGSGRQSESIEMQSITNRKSGKVVPISSISNMSMKDDPINNMHTFDNDNYSMQSRFKGNSISSRNKVMPMSYVNQTKETSRTADNDYLGMNKHTSLGP